MALATDVCRTRPPRAPLAAACLLALGAFLLLPAATHAQGAEGGLRTEGWLWVEQSTGLHNESSQALTTGPTGEVYVAGQFWGEATFGTFTLSNTSGNYADGFLVKYDADGTALWAHLLSATREVDMAALAVDADGNLYAAGRFWGTATIGDTTLTAPAISVGDLFLAKYDAEGALLWVRQVGGTVGPYAHHVQSIALAPDGALYLTGGFLETAVFGEHVLESAGNLDLFLVRVSPEGVFEWARRGGGGVGDIGYGVVVDPAGHVFVAGSFRGTATFGDTTLVTGGGADALLLRYDAAGEVEWARRGAGIYDATVWSLALAPNGDVVVGGSFGRDLAFGGATLQAPNNFEDGFVIRFDADGAPVWAQRIGGEFGDSVGSLVVDASGRTFVTGSFIGPATFAGTPMAGYGGPELFVGALSPDGDPTWVDVADGTEPSGGSGVALHPGGGIVLTGGFVGSVILGDTTLHNTSDPARRDMVLARYGEGSGEPTAADASAGPEGFALGAAYPNPSSGQAILTLGVGQGQRVEVAVYDVLGRRVASLHSGPLAAGVHAFALDSSALTAGAYVVRALGASATVSRRVTVVR